MIIIFVGILSLILHQLMAQVIDVGNDWYTNCPQSCSCQISRFSDLPLNQWLHPTNNIPFHLGQNFYNNDHNIADEFLKSAICILSDDPSKLLVQLPSNLQALTILESGNGDKELALKAEDLQRFTEIVALDIQGMEHNEKEINFDDEIITRSKNKGTIVMTVDTLLPLGLNLLYLNLERVTLTSLSLINKNKANLVVKPMNNSQEKNEDVKTNSSNSSMSNKMTSNSGHRLIFLSQQNADGNEDKEILPYDIYKQELEGYRETGGLFTGLNVLTHLRVYDCALKDISWHMFDGLENLLYLSLEKNDLKFIPEFCFYGTPKLKTLSLAHNQLLTLSSVDLAGLLMLERLDLSGNNLTFLSELSFPPFPVLYDADFRNNPFDNLFPNTFEIMNKTVRLYIGGNGSKIKLQKNSFLGLRNLEVLQVFDVDVPLLERFIFNGMPKLFHLKMMGNITTIDFDAFMDLNALEDLDLSNCYIKHISMDAFYGLRNVKRIDLSYNELEFIPPGLFSIQQQKNLKEIKLNKNLLTRLPLDFFRHLRTFNKNFYIQTLRLDGNPWDCTCAMATWNPYLVNKVKETAPRCFTPKKLRNWGIFHALRKGGLQCKRPKVKQSRTLSKILVDQLDGNSIN